MIHNLTRFNKAHRPPRHFPTHTTKSNLECNLCKSNQKLIFNAIDNNQKAEKMVTNYEACPPSSFTTVQSLKALRQLEFHFDRKTREFRA